MKYIKKFEKLITLDLEQKELDLLMGNAVSTNNLIVIRSLLDNGFDISSNQKVPLIFKAAYKNNIEMVKLFSEFGANLNIKNHNKSIIMTILSDSIDMNQTLTGAANNLKKYFEIIILLIKLGEEIDEDFMTELNNLKNKRNIGRTADELYSLIINECPKEYERYEIYKTSNKFNI